MESELLEPCPVCGRGCEVVEGDDETGGVFCACGYRLDDEEMKGIAEDAIARHNALCRRAEIGARVEQVLKAKLHVGVNRKPMSDGSSVYTTFLFDEGVQYAVNHADSILDALRSLAAKLEELTDE